MALIIPVSEWSAREHFLTSGSSLPNDPTGTPIVPRRPQLDRALAPRQGTAQTSHETARGSLLVASLRRVPS
jgi:hypothetical protein